MRQYHRILLFITMFCNLLFSHSINKQQWCQTYFEKTEKKFNIPKNTLQAIAFTESGQYFKGKGIIAWPWSINVMGKGYIFPTKEKAVHAAEFLIRSGHKNFDIGCMQINYKHHGAAFKTLHDAFSPEQNVDYAGQFLKSLFDKNQSWKVAQAHYHSSNPEFHIPYLKLVEKHFKRLTDTHNYIMPLNIDNLIHAQKELKQHFQQSENIRQLSLEKTVKSILGSDTPYKPIPETNQKVRITNFSKLNQLQTIYGGKIISQTPQTRPINTKGFQHLNTLTIASKRYTPEGGNTNNFTKTSNIKSGIVKIMRYK
jgi:hypothetical protein